MAKRPRKKRHVVFLDFDNTITSYDVFDDILENFAGDRAWLELEKRWKKGEIGSKECLAGQIECVRVARRILDRYLDKVEIDPYSKRLLGLLRQ